MPDLMPSRRWHAWSMAAANVLGAFLLFQVQPMIAKFILPWFGGAAAVWITCMLFFQVALLAGYVYAHVLTTRLAGRTRRLVHSAVVGASLLFLPIVPAASWKQAGAGEPALQILLLLAVVVGAPYMVLASTSPLIQAEYANRFRGAAVPYHFYALSNLGSLIALLSYPVIVEPHLGVTTQIYVWSAAFVVYGCLVVGVMLFRRSEADELEPARGEAEGGGLRWVWFAGPACATLALMAGTQYLLENVAAVPLLWVVPLSAYLLSFMICFDRRQIYRNGVFRIALLAAIGLGLALVMFPVLRFRIGLAMAGVTFTVFAIAVYCHGEVYVRRPGGAELTKFYLAISAGGALGGLVAGLVLPMTLTVPLDFVLSLGAALAFGFALEFRTRWMGLAMAALVGLLVVVGNQQRVQFYRDTIAAERGFYGTLAVRQYEETEDLPGRRVLLHGVIEHGSEIAGPEGPRKATTYFAEGSGVELAIRKTRRPGQRVGIIGLGVGSIAAYGRPGDYYRFYEISPEVLKMNREHFRIVRGSAARVDVVLGDARVQLEREEGQGFDVLAVDAFSGDAIPVHLLTVEAMRTYLRHLAPGGVLAVHVSNQVVDLEPVVGAVMREVGLEGRLFATEHDSLKFRHPSRWVLAGVDDGTVVRRRPELRLWNDEFTNLWAVLRPWE